MCVLSASKFFSFSRVLLFSSFFLGSSLFCVKTLVCHDGDNSEPPVTHVLCASQKEDDLAPIQKLPDEMLLEIANRIGSVCDRISFFKAMGVTPSSNQLLQGHSCEKWIESFFLEDEDFLFRIKGENNPRIGTSFLSLSGAIGQEKVVLGICDKRIDLDGSLKTTHREWTVTEGVDAALVYLEYWAAS